MALFFLTGKNNKKLSLILLYL